MLGIAAKSGNVQSGEFSTEKAVKSYRAYLAITDENLAKAVMQKLSDYKTE